MAQIMLDKEINDKTGQSSIKINKNTKFWNAMVHAFWTLYEENDLNENLNLLSIIYKHDAKI